MIIKSLYSLLLSVAVLGLISCSSENNEEHLATAGSSTRSFVVSQDNAPMTRTNISLTDGITWNAGDRLFAYNVTNPQGYDYLTAISDGRRSNLKGDIHWKEGDELALFYPFRHVYRENMGKVDLGLSENTLYHKGELVVRRQNGTMENLRYFDYAWGKLKNVNTAGKDVWANFRLQRQYTILCLKVVFEGQPVSDIKHVTLQNVYDEATFDLATGKMTYEKPKGSLRITADTPLETFYVALFPDDKFKPTYVIETVNGDRYYATVAEPLNYQAAKYYEYTINATKSPCPWVDIDGKRWGKYNLQYDPCTRVEGWVPCYRLAKQPWDYFYTNSNPFNLCPEFLPRAFSTSAFDHFRWGSIAAANNYSHDYSRYHSYHMGNLQGVIENKCYGDLAYYASNGQWVMPTKADFDKLMAKTGEYVGYYQEGCNIIVGVLFDPTVPACNKGKVLDKNGCIIGKTNCPNGIFVGKYYNRNTRMKKFSKEDIDKGVFFPFAGAYTEYNDCAPRLQRPGGQAYYWTSNANSCNYKQAAAFSAYYMNNGWLYPGTVNGCGSGNNPKYNMYSIRPVCVNSDSKTQQSQQSQQTQQTKKGW